MKHRKKTEDHDVTRPEEPTKTVSFGLGTPSGEREFHRGEVVGRYVVLEPIGRGGMGVVLSAYDPDLDRKVAIKLLHAGAPGSGGERARLRLQREARAMAKLSHPNVVTVHDVGLFEGEVFVAMEFVRGRTLAGWREEHADASWREVVEIFLSAGVGLKAAHEKGLVHRDFKPDNVLVAHDGAVKVTDFGLARAARPLANDATPASPSAPPASTSVAARSGDDLLETPLTEHGAVIGTPAYLPPEAYGEAGHLDARSDQFAFCVALWDALFGSKPYIGSDYPALLTAMVQGKLREPPEQHGVPQSVLEIVRRGLRPLPKDRWTSMDELLVALRLQMKPEEPPTSRWRAVVWAGLPLALVLAGLLWWNYRDNLCAGVDKPLDAVWNQERRQSLIGAASKAAGPDAGSLGHRLVAIVDAWADRWSQTRIDACRATAVRGEQSEQLLDLRMACLDQKLQEMGFVLGLLQDSEPDVLSDASVALRRAAPLHQCSDAEALLAPVRPPNSQQARQRVVEIRTQLADAEATLLAGQPQEATRKAREAEAAATDLGYPPLRAEAAGLAAQTLRNTSEFAAARDAAHRSLSAALYGRHEYELASSLIHLMNIDGSDMEDFDLAERWYEHARGALQRVGKSRTQLEAKLMHGWGGVLYRQGRFQDSLEAFQRAYDLQLELNGPSNPDALAAANNLVVLLYSTGRIQEAHDRLVKLAEQMETTLGEHHPHLLSVLSNLSGTSASLARLDDCVEYASLGASRFESVYGKDTPSALTALSNLGVCLDKLGRYEDSLTVHERALAISRAAFGEENSQTVRELANRAMALSGLGRHEKAIEAVQRSIELGESSSEMTGTPSSELISAIGSLSSILRGANHPKESVDAARRAIALLTEADRLTETGAAPFFIELGESLLAAKQPVEAMSAFETALERTRSEREEAGSVVDSASTVVEDPESLATAQLGLARALHASGRDAERATSLAREAQAFFEGREGVDAEMARAQIGTLVGGGS